MSEDLTATEVWENRTDGQVWLFSLDGLGRRQERAIEGRGARATIKASDRLVMQEVAPRNNPFNNGSLKLVSGPAETEDAEHLSDEDFQAILKSRQPKLGRTLAGLSDLDLGILAGMIDEDTKQSTVDAVKEEQESRQPKLELLDLEDGI